MLKFIELDKNVIMFKGQPQTSYNKLIEAIETKNITEAQKLVAEVSITELNQVRRYSETVLTLAIRQGLDKVCESLITKMTQYAIDHHDDDHNTALTLAICQRLDKVCESLILKMSDHAINQINKYDYTALTLAIYNKSEKICEMLIPKMSRQAINRVDEEGYTALIIAAKIGLDKICEMLIPKMSRQAIIHINFKGEAALNIAKDKGLKNTYDLLYKIDKKDIFQRLTDELNYIIVSTALNFKNKVKMETRINNITYKAKLLTNKDDIEQVTNNIQKLLSNDKIIKGNIQIIRKDITLLEKQIDELVACEDINNAISILGRDFTFE